MDSFYSRKLVGKIDCITFYMKKRFINAITDNIRPKCLENKRKKKQQQPKVQLILHLKAKLTKSPYRLRFYLANHGVVKMSPINRRRITL